MIEEPRRFRRKVLPLDIEVNVDLQDVITHGPGYARAPYVDVYPLADWIEDGWVYLNVLSPHHLISPDHRGLFDQAKHVMSGGPGHRSLCALAATYMLTVLDKDVRISGNSTCSYSGGWADVAAKDGSIYAECGTLNPRKPIDAMLAGETLLVLPYTLGCDKPDEGTISRLDPFPERDASEPIEIRKYLKWGRVQLAYAFTPRCKLRVDFGRPLGLRPPRENWDG